MNLPMSWLNDYMDIDVTPKEYSDRLTMTGSKVEGWENMGESVQNVVAGKVLTCEDHPDSDHLHVCTVDAGTGEILQIVCGAPNVKAGIIVPVALVGAVLPDGKIKKGKLRGVESYGMLCSHDELGITEDMLGYEPEYGILILPDDTKIGTDIKDIFGMNETVVEFEITSNRPDCFSIIGLARETAASFNKKFTIPEVKFNENSENIADIISVDVQDKDKCARMVKNVKIGPSPSWMQERLRACGVRPINNIVDITNYVLLEYGQPMHAFDSSYIEGNAIHVRRAHDKEKIMTLDEKEFELNENNLVICDGVKPVALAGIMGGLNSEIRDTTEAVIFESAKFARDNIRKSSRALGQSSDSSQRYAKGVDEYATVMASKRALHLIEELGCGKVSSTHVEVSTGNSIEPAEMKASIKKVNGVLGIEVPTADIERILKSFLKRH